jgi:hypothetical protein
MFERERGLNDWRIQNLGEIKDLKFLENTSLVYTLSTSGVLTLFDTEKQEIIWKKELPQIGGAKGGEDFKLRYLSRNLLVYSERRALLLNSASHVIYDLHFEGTEETITEFFELKGHVYSVFAKGNKVIIYKDYQQVGGSLEYVTENSFEGVRPLQMIYERTSQKLILLALTEASVMTTFTVDVIN